MEIINEMLNNLLPLLSTSTGIFTIYITSNITRSLKVGKQNKKRNWSLSKQIPSISGETYKPIEYAKFDKNELKKLQSILERTKYPQELEDIIQEFKKKVSPENFQTCLRNLKYVKIEQTTLENDAKTFITNLLSLTPYAGYYNPYYNLIKINSSIIKRNVLTHEFLHMASARDELSFGFQCITRFNNQEIGRGINEGYTELLNHRIFGSRSLSYFHNVKITKLFETFFDNPKDMENAYFHGDFETLYRVFSQYGSKEEFFEIMNNLDNLATTKIPIYNTINSIKTQLKLYKIVKRCKDVNKIKQFKSILDQNPLTKILRSGQKITLANKPTLKAKTK